MTNCQNVHPLLQRLGLWGAKGHVFKTTMAPSLSGEYDRVGQGSGHPQAVWAQGGGSLCPGGRDDFPDGVAGPELHLHRQLRLLPQAARRGALWVQCPPKAL